MSVPMAEKKKRFTPKKSNRIKPAGKSNYRFFSLLILVIICAVLCVTMYYLKQKEVHKQAEKLAEINRLERLIAEEEARTETIANYKAYVQTTGYIEQIAREVLGLVYKDEVIFVPAGDNGN